MAVNAIPLLCYVLQSPIKKKFSCIINLHVDPSLAGVILKGLILSIYIDHLIQ